MARLSDRIFGLVIIVVALAYIAGAMQTQTSFLSDPVGSKTFPVIIGGVAIICALIMILRPDADPDWPEAGILVHLAVALAVLIAFSYTVKPLGLILPTAVASGVLSFQIRPRPVAAVITGIATAVGLFVLFRYGLGLGVHAFPREFLG